MKRYMLFTFDNYYPQGGMDDFKESFDGWRDAVNYFSTNCDEEYCQVFDTVNREIIYKNYQ